MALEKQVYEVDQTVTPVNGEVNGKIALVDSSGAPITLAPPLPALPESNGLYALQVTGGVYTWVEAEPAT